MVLTSFLCIEALLNSREQVLRATRRAHRVCDEVRGLACKPLVLECLLRRRPFVGILGQTHSNKVPGRFRDVHPILFWFEGIVTGKDGLHLLLLVVTIERRVAAEEEIGDDTHCPYVDRFSLTRYDANQISDG